MGWTRNAQNTVYTNCVSRTTTTNYNESTWGFDDTNPWSFKTHLGKIYQIPVNADCRVFNNTSSTTGAGLLNTSASAGVLNFTPPSISAQEPVGAYQVYGNYSVPSSTLRFGSGDAEESFEDCGLSGEILNCSGYCSRSSINYIGNGSFEADMEYTVTANENMTIKEWGIFTGVNISWVYTSITYRIGAEYLVYRKKLDVPISLISKTPISLHIHLEFPKLSLLGDGWTRNAQNALYSFAFIRFMSTTTTTGYNDFTDEYPWIFKLLNGSTAMIAHNQGAASVTSSLIPLVVGSGNLSVPTVNVASESHGGGFTNYDTWPGTCIVFGSGSTPQTFEDYHIESFVPCEKISSSFQVITNVDGTFTISGNVLAKALEDETIREWALYENLFVYNPSIYNNYLGPYMLYRKVLDEPIVLQRGEPFSMHIELNLPKLSIS